MGFFNGNFQVRKLVVCQIWDSRSKKFTALNCDFLISVYICYQLMRLNNSWMNYHRIVLDSSYRVLLSFE